MLPADEARDTKKGPGSVYTPPLGVLPWFDPLTIEVAADLSVRPVLNVLLPGLAMKHMSGGPNTVVNLAYRLAALDVPVRFVSTNAAIDADPARFWSHVRALAGIDTQLSNVELVDASDRSKPLVIGANDIFMATAWWTAQMAKYAIRHTQHSRFIYVIQDYEPLLHAASTQQALAEETYGLDHIPVVNTSLLHEFLVTRQIGRFADPVFAARAMVFEPAVDTALFFAEPDRQPARGCRRRLLFYARPVNGLRNLFELGLAAMQKVIADRAIDPADWEFLGMGDKFAPIDLGSGARLEPAPWLDLDGYARQMRESDVLLSLMLSPHPSYPPLEMAACGKPVVTTCFANKSAERLAAISPNIIGVEPTIEAIAEGLVEAVRRPRHPSGTPPTGTHFPRTWSESFAETLPRLHKEVMGLIGAPSLPASVRLAGDVRAPWLFPGYRCWPSDWYGLFRHATLRERRADYVDGAAELISFLTPLWNTDPAFVEALAESVFGQDSGTGFEWIILDNGSARQDTREMVRRLAGHPSVRLFRVEENIGIIGGMRYCLERARNRYVVPLDSDDLLTPDCVRVLTSALRSAGFPALAYTDEDKVMGDRFRDAYYKPAWDPVLFVHSCYIAHLCAIDREIALQLAAYTDHEVEGSHDWDTFMRFFLVGHVPHHVPEVLYSWRMHPQSTAADIHSKDYIYSSQRHVIERFVAASAIPQRYRVELSPLFKGMPDWRIIRAPDAPLPITTIVFDEGRRQARWKEQFAGHSIERISNGDDLSALLGLVERCVAGQRFVHLLSAEVVVEDQTWAHEAMTMFELFPDTAVVGGAVHRGGTIAAADGYFGFGTGCDSPNIGRRVSDSGYFAHMFKPRSVCSVPIQHCVVRSDFLVDALRDLGRTGVTCDELGPWLAAAARREGLRVVYSPFLRAKTRRAIKASPTQTAAFIMSQRSLMPERELLSARLGLTRDTAYQPVLRSVRRQQEAAIGPAADLSYDESARAEVMSRLVAQPVTDLNCHFSILTSVYARSPADLFRETARSVLGQSLANFEWIVFEDGPVSDEMQRALREIEGDPRVRRFRGDRNRGIIDGLRFCLERASGDYVMPLDGDDLLARDALQQLAIALARAEWPPIIFSDEDFLVEGRLETPFRRGDFDPVLSAADSYIWHLCAFRRTRALELDVFGDPGANFCQDWDTLTRFSAAGDRIVHVPLVLYHWRTHRSSVSNSGKPNPGSLASVKHVMEGIIRRQRRPELYEVAPFPLSRGVEQYAINRRRVDPLLFDVVILARNSDEPELPEILTRLKGSIIRSVRVIRSAHALTAANNNDTAIGSLEAKHALVMVDGCAPEDEAGFWEAMRLFEMHPDVAAAGGRVVDETDRIVVSCAPPAAGSQAAAGWAGRLRSDPGPFAMALKPQSTAMISGPYFFCRVDMLREAAAALAEEDKPLAELGAEVVARVRSRGMRVAYSPLIEAVLSSWVRAVQPEQKPVVHQILAK